MNIPAKSSTPTSRRIPFWLRLGFLLACAWPTIVGAATYTWTGAGFFGNKDYLWSNPNNWAELNAPQDGEQGVQLVFPNSGAPRASTNDVVNLVLASVVFQGANYNLHGPGANGITMNLRGDNGGPFTIVAAAAGCQFGSSTRLHLASTGQVAVASGDTLTIKSRVSGIFGFDKISPGTLSFQGLQANTFTGPLTVRQGIADFRGIGTAMPGSLIVGDGSANSTAIARLYLNDQIGDDSPVTVNANGALELDGHNDTIGSLTLASGTVTMTQGIITGTLTLNGNVTNHVGVGDEAGVIRGKLSLGSTTRGFHVDAGSELRVEADVSGVTAGLTKSGLGQLTLSGANNTYAGSTTVQAGKLLLHGATPGSANNGTIVGLGASLQLWDVNIGDELLSLNGATNKPVLAFAGTNSWDGNVTVTGDCLIDVLPFGAVENHLTLGGNIGGAGSLHLIGWGHLHLTGFGNNTFSGGYYGESGLTHFEKSASAAALGGPLFVGRADDSFPSAHVIVGTLNQIPNNALVTLRNSGALTADANDTLGDVVFEGGWIVCGNGEFTIAGNVTSKASPQNTSSIYCDILLSAGEHIFTIDPKSILDVYGAMKGSGAVTITGESGVINFFNTNTYSGLTRIQGGELYLLGKGRPGSGAAGTVLEGSGALHLGDAAVTNETLTVNAPNGTYRPINLSGTSYWKGAVVLNGDVHIRQFSGAQLTVDGPISGPGGIVYEGSNSGSSDGTLVFVGGADNTFQGGITILEGTLLLNKIGRSIPTSLTIGHETNGGDWAVVRCLRPGQFTPAADAAQMNDWRVTVNPVGSLDCNGFDQIVTGITTRHGAVFTGGATLSLQQGWRTEPDSGTSQFIGNLRLNSLFNNFTHILNVETNTDLLLWGDVSQAGFLAHVEKQGKGTLSMLSSNSFAGNLTLREGLTVGGGPQPYGTVNGFTRVDYDATLITFDGTNAEPFTLTGSGYQKKGALVVMGNTSFTGPIFLGYNADIVTPGATNRAEFSGAISGPGGITKLGPGKIVLSGNDDNTYAGATKAKEGQLELAKTNATAVRGALEIDANGLVRYLRDDQLSDLTPVSITNGGEFRLLGHHDTIGSLAGSGIVELLGGNLLTGNDNTETTFAGVISGIGGNLTKIGTNSFTLAGDNVYTGTTFVKDGTLLVRGNQPLSDVTIQTGGILGGNGRVGTISDLNGHVRPGTGAYGILKCAGFLTHNPANQLQIEITGTTPGVSYDQLDVAGGVTLMGGALQVVMNFTGAVSNQYVIVKNDGNDPVTGSFLGLPQDALLTNNGAVFQITYTGGDGNDVALIQRSVAGVGPQLGGVTKLSDGTIQLGGTGIPNATYTVEATDSLTAPVDWLEIGKATANAQGEFSFIDAEAPKHPVRFYRFRLP